MWLRIIILLSITIILINLFKTTQQEGFIQNEKFVLKQNNKIYDEFYLQIYPQLIVAYSSSEKSSYATEIDFILKNTMPDVEHSVFLEIGPNGFLLDKLQDNGFTVFGLDKSKDLCNYFNTIFPNLEIKNENAINPMIYDRNIFTHILCFGNTIYEIPTTDKFLFFKNCYYWLKTGGFLIIELCNSIPVYNNKINFKNFKYIRKINNKKETVLITENFIDNKTNFIRQNENTLYIDNIINILKITQSIGFSVYGKYEYSNKNSFIYILAK
jgi:hypothetical protein